MELTEVLRRRRMVRRFAPEPLTDHEVETILAASLRAPSAGSTQGTEILVLVTHSERSRFWAATTDPDAEETAWLAGLRPAPLLLVVCACREAYLRRYAEPDKGWDPRDEARWSAPYWDIDAGMAALLALLAAVDLGLGACFFGVPPDRLATFRATFAVPERFRPVGVVAVGHPAPGEAPRRPARRRSAEERVHRGWW